MPQPQAGAPGTSSQVQEHPPTRVLGLAGSSVTIQILTWEEGRREVAPPIPHGVTLEATDSPRRNTARMGNMDATAVGVSYLGGERRQRPRGISGSGWATTAAPIASGTGQCHQPHPSLGAAGRRHRAPGAALHAQGAKSRAAVTTQGLPPPCHRPNRDHE